MLTVILSTVNMRASAVGALSESVCPYSHGGDSDRQCAAATWIGRACSGGFSEAAHPSPQTRLGGGGYA